VTIAIPGRRSPTVAETGCRPAIVRQERRIPSVLLTSSPAPRVVDPVEPVGFVVEDGHLPEVGSARVSGSKMDDGLTALLDGPQQMSFGERAALEGVLALASPGLALEIGTAEGGSLRRIAAHAGEVHSFDLVAPPGDVASLPNVRFHTGDSHKLLPALLRELAESGRNVDFVLVDGDHSAEGVRKDLENLLTSAAVSSTLILLHDTANEAVRSGIDAVPLDDYDKVRYADMDFVAGYLFRAPQMLNELWGGLGFVVVDADHPRAPGEPARQERVFETAGLLREVRAARIGDSAFRSAGARSLARRATERLRRVAGRLRRAAAPR
jgi:hypothetical protein